jgi:glycosyltransferase involved in cell wall biosynthesis
MKVLIVCHGYPPDGVAGVERLSAQTAETLSSRGHEVTVLTRQPSEWPATLALRRDTRAGVPVVSIAGGGSTGEAFPGYEPSLERIFERMLAEASPDAILATHLMHHSPGYVQVAHRWGIPVVLELHDFFMLCPRAHLLRRTGDLCEGPEGGSACASYCFGDQPDARLRWGLRSQSFAEALRDADAVLAPSRSVVDAFASRRGEGQIQVVPNAVADFGPVLRPEAEAHRSPLRLASIGVTVEHKGFQTVVSALRLAGLPASSYIIFGVALPPLAAELQEAGDEIPGLELRLFNGFQPEHLPALLAEVDAMVVPSLVPETYSIVAREAFACGIPVIASAIGALPEAIRDGENGWLFEPGDASGLAMLLRRLDHDRSLLRRAAEQARNEDVITSAGRTDAVEAILRSAVERGPRDRGPETSELPLMREALIEADVRQGFR